MAIAIVQTVTTDAAPSNNGPLGAFGGTYHMRVASATGFAAGSYLVGISGIPNFAGTTWGKFTDPVNGDWTTLEHLNCASAPGGVADGLDVGFSLFQSTGAIAPGSVGLVSVGGAGTATCTKFDGTSPGWTVNQWVNATFTEYSTGVSGTVSANTANTLTFSGGGSPPNGNPFSVGGYVRSNVSKFDDFPFALVTEVSGASSSFGHNSNQNSFSSAATVSTGTVAAWSGTGLAISYSMDDNDDGTSPYNPLSATGTDDGVFWQANLATGILRMQHQIVTSPGSAYGMNFTTQTADHHMAYIVVLQQTPVAADVLLGAMDM